MWHDVTGDGGVQLTWSARNESAAAGLSPGDAGAEFLEMDYEVFAVRRVSDLDEEVEESVDSSQYPLVVMVGEKEVVDGLDAALPKLRPGDRAQILIDQRYGYGSDPAKLPPGIRPDDKLRFHIHVKDVRAVRKATLNDEVQPIDQSEVDRLEQVREERELAAQRREEEKEAKEAKRREAAARAAARLAGKGQKKGSKKKK